ncbi:hypothetical protein KHA80_14090 [Anaerobacillus sp. HL2]|nr:hypothetical protein KHA80_14090 [Anaerobacillus sp. HL2]
MPTPKDANEPFGMVFKYCLSSLELVGTKELPKPDKTKIDSWNFHQFTHNQPQQLKVNYRM